jgi:2-polyprenyl-3-methyl-5-hydroxy-6-metoxy-1,4-benzoquinol methylase
MTVPPIGVADRSRAHAARLRAHASLGRSSIPIHDMVAATIARHHQAGGVLYDIGCGAGDLLQRVAGRFDRCVGVDIARYGEFPSGTEFVEANLDADAVPLPAGSADVVTAVETIEHLENPRAFMRQLARLARPGGWIIVTTPNQHSVLSVLSLIVHRQFAAFRDSSYPAHLTALLETDLRRIAGECGLTSVTIQFSGRGRIPLTSRHFPPLVSRRWPRAFSDNVMLIGRTVA